MIAAERLWLTASGDRLVGDGDVDAAVLFAAPGDEISDEDVAAFGLDELAVAEKPEPTPEPTPEPAPEPKPEATPEPKPESTPAPKPEPAAAPAGDSTESPKPAKPKTQGK